MKKLTLALAATAAMAFAGTAYGDPVVEVVPSNIDPAINVFDGEYQTGDPDNPTGTQQGYVAVYETGVEACQGNPDIPGPRGPLVGYIWVGSDHAASNQLTPFGDDAGAGNNHTNADGSPTGNSPCPAHGS